MTKACLEHNDRYNDNNQNTVVDSLFLSLVRVQVFQHSDHTVRVGHGSVVGTPPFASQEQSKLEFLLLEL